MNSLNLKRKEGDYLLSISVSGITVSGVGKGVGGDMGGLNGLAGGLGDGVLNIGAVDLGDGVAVLDLNGDNLDLGVVNTVLGGDLPAGVLHGGDSGVGNSVGNRVGKRGNSMSSISTKSVELRISFSISFPLHNSVSNNRGNSGGAITEGVNNILAHLLVLDLLGINNLGGANILGSRSTSLGDQDLVLSFTVGSMIGSS